MLFPTFFDAIVYKEISSLLRHLNFKISLFTKGQKRMCEFPRFISTSDRGRDECFVNFLKNQNFSGAKAPLWSSWDPGRVAPFVVSVTERIFLKILLSKCYSLKEYLEMQKWTNCIEKNDTHINKQTNSNFININLEALAQLKSHD